MRLDGIRVGDLVLVDKKGRRFHAEITGRTAWRHEVDVKPLDRRITYRTATSREIVRHWRAAPQLVNRVGRGRRAALPISNPINSQLFG